MNHTEGFPGYKLIKLWSFVLRKAKPDGLDDNGSLFSFRQQAKTRKQIRL